MTAILAASLTDDAPPEIIGQIAADLSDWAPYVLAMALLRGAAADQVRERIDAMPAPRWPAGRARPSPGVTARAAVESLAAAQTAVIAAARALVEADRQADPFRWPEAVARHISTLQSAVDRLDAELAEGPLG